MDLPTATEAGGPCDRAAQQEGRAGNRCAWRNQLLAVALSGRAGGGRARFRSHAGSLLTGLPSDASAPSPQGRAGGRP